MQESGRRGLTAKGAEQLRQYFSKKVSDDQKLSLSEMDGAYFSGLFPTFAPKVGSQDMALRAFSSRFPHLRLIVGELIPHRVPETWSIARLLTYNSSADSGICAGSARIVALQMAAEEADAGGSGFKVPSSMTKRNLVAKGADDETGGAEDGKAEEQGSKGEELDDEDWVEDWVSGGIELAIRTRDGAALVDV